MEALQSLRNRPPQNTVTETNVITQLNHWNRSWDAHQSAFHLNSSRKHFVYSLLAHSAPSTLVCLLYTWSIQHPFPGQTIWILKPWKRSRHVAKSTCKVGSDDTLGGIAPKLEKTIPAFVNNPNSETLSFCKEVQGILQLPWCSHGTHPKMPNTISWLVAYGCLHPNSKPAPNMMHTWCGSDSPATAQIAALQQVQLTLYSAHVEQHATGFTWPLSMVFWNLQIFKAKCSSHLRACRSPSTGSGEGAHQGGP